MKINLGPCVQYLAALMGVVMFSTIGTSRGWAAPMVPRLLGNETHITCSADQVSWLVSTKSFTKMAYTVVFFFVVNRVGRKVFLLAACVPSLVSWLMTAFATSCEELIAAKALDGIAGTIFYVVPSVYISEVSRNGVRGFFAIMKDVAEILANFAITGIAPYVSYEALALIPAALPALGFLIFLWMPESPYYHLLNNRRDLAEDSLRRLRGVDDVSKELLKMQQFVDQRAHDKNPKITQIVNTPHKRLAFTIGLVLMVCMMWSGNSILGEYKTLLFRLSNTGKENADTYATILIAVQFVASIVALFCVERFGRRPLLIFSCTFSALAMTVGASSFLWDVGPPWLPLAWTTVFMAAYTCGIGSVHGAVCAEIFPADAKILSLTCLSLCLALATSLALKLIPLIIDNCGVTTVLWCSDIVILLELVFVVLFVPETKSKPFASIQEDLDDMTNERSCCWRRYKGKTTLTSVE